MKRLSSLLMVLVLVLGCAGAVAQTQEVNVDYEGAWVNCDDTFKIYLPVTFSEGEVAKEDADMGIFAAYADSASNTFLALQWLDGAGQTLEDLGNTMLADTANYQNVVSVTFNGVPFIVYDVVNASTCMCSDGEAGFYVFSFVGDEASGELGMKIMASLSPADVA
ncbi:MAG: hypothetical protein RR337_06685 [Clostridia bacterium]